MADIGSELRIYLKTISIITDIIGAGTAAKMFIHDAKPGTDPPYIVYGIEELGSAEWLGGITGLAGARAEIVAVGTTAAEAYNLAERIRLGPLHRYRGYMNGTFVHGVSSRAGYQRGWDKPSDGFKQKRYWVLRDYLINYEESTVSNF